VLYEMLSGARAFPGATATDTLASILKDDPDWGKLPADTPAVVRRLIRRCLSKDRRDRLRDIADVRMVVQDVIEQPQDSASVATTTTSKQKVLPGAIATAAIVLSTVILTVAVMTTVGILAERDEDDVTRFVVKPPEGTQVPESYYASPVTISPDGNQLVFVGTRAGVTQLFRRPMSSFESIPMPDTEDAECPRFSPDGRWVAFFAHEKLRKVSLETGSVTNVCDARDGLAIDWATENRILFSQEYHARVFSVPASGGQPSTVPTIGPDEDLMTSTAIDSHREGDTLLLTIETGGGIESKRIELVSTTNGVRRTLIEGGDHGQISQSGHLVYSRGNSILAAPIDVDRLQLTGPAVQVLEGTPGEDRGGEASAHFQISETGTLVYLANHRSLTGEPVWVDRQGRSEPILDEPRSFWAPMLSPDGRRLAMSTVESVMETWILDLDRRALSRFTFDQSNHISVWRPDGRHIAFSSNRDGPYNLYIKPSDGSGMAERLTVYEGHQDPASWSPDGRTLAFAQYHPVTDWDIGLVHFEPEPRQEVFINTSFREFHPMISPDGQWLAYVSDETGRLEVYVQPFPDGGSKWLVSIGGGTEPLWAPSGEELFYRNGDQVMMVAIGPGPDFVAGSPELLFETPALLTTGLGLPDYDISPDGQRFVMIAPENQARETEIYVVQNWFAELNRIVPGGSR
jgi:WD40 repeat protein